MHKDTPTHRHTDTCSCFVWRGLQWLVEECSDLSSIYLYVYVVTTTERRKFHRNNCWESVYSEKKPRISLPVSRSDLVQPCAPFSSYVLSNINTKVLCASFTVTVPGQPIDNLNFFVKVLEEMLCRLRINVHKTYQV